MNRQMTNSLRRYGSRSVLNLKSDPQIKIIIQDELKDLISNSVQEYLKNNKIPVASINIKVENDCHHCVPDNKLKESPTNIRLNISTSTVDKEVCKKIENYDKAEVKKTEDDNYHWMTWRDSASDVKKKEVEGNRLKTAQEFTCHPHHCNSPFMRPSTSYHNVNNQVTHQEYSVRPRPCSRDSIRRYRCASADPRFAPVKKTSVAVGPDKHFQTTATNTQKSYQISDYLKKSMDLSDPYERKIFSSLMDVLRKKNHNHNSVDTESVAADPIVQISEYKSKFRNPQNKMTLFPTSKIENALSIKRPPSCPHKTRLLGQLRPSSTSYPRHQQGEQYLY